MKKLIAGTILVLMLTGLLIAQETKTTLIAKNKGTKIIRTIATTTLTIEQLKNEYLNNQKKGKELFKLKQFKESIIYSDKAIFYQNTLLEKLRNKETALNKLKEADSWIKKAKTVISTSK